MPPLRPQQGLSLPHLHKHQSIWEKNRMYCTLKTSPSSPFSHTSLAVLPLCTSLLMSVTCPHLEEKRSYQQMKRGCVASHGGQRHRTQRDVGWAGRGREDSRLGSKAWSTSLHHKSRADTHYTGDTEQQQDKNQTTVMSLHHTYMSEHHNCIMHLTRLK